MFASFNKLAFYFTDIGNTLEFIGMSMIIAVPTAIVFVAVGYQMRWVMEPIRVRYALSEAKKAKHELKIMKQRMEEALSLIHKAELHDKKTETMATSQRHTSNELRQLASLKLLKGVNDDNT